MKKHLLSIVALFFLFLLLPACGEEEQDPESSATPVEIQLVEKGSIAAETRVSVHTDTLYHLLECTGLEGCDCFLCHF